MSNWRQREARQRLFEAEEETRREVRNAEILGHEATAHIADLNKTLNGLGDTTDLYFQQKAVVEALRYLLKRVRDEDISR
jgi:hypothetical protein